jgi:hypothetical protein
VGWKKPKSLSTKEKGANLENGSANKKLGNITTKVPPGGENILKATGNTNFYVIKASQRVFNHETTFESNRF